MKHLLIATTNPGKLNEFYTLLRDLDVELVTPADLGLDLQVEENGASYTENAVLKARAYCRAGRIPALADDSGLEVEALDGAPGIFSARYSADPCAGDAGRRAALLKNLMTFPQPWKACFRAVVAIAVPAASPGGLIRVDTAEGVCRGEIIPEERGENGFGYDPIFLLPELNLTMAQLEDGEKTRLSHRARAVAAAGTLIRRLLEEEKG